MAKSKFKSFKKSLAKLEGFDGIVEGAAKPGLWVGYASAVGAVESLAKEGKGGNKVNKRKHQALKALRKLAKHSGGKKAVRAAKPPKPSAPQNGTETHIPLEAPAVARLIGTPDAPANVVSLDAAARQPVKAKDDNDRAPGALDGPLDGKGDDLQLIAGVGPKLEQTLHSLGIWHYEQVAAWGPAEIAWVDEHLRFSGRIEREDWVAQAAALSRGGRDEYVRVFGKEPR